MQAVAGDFLEAQLAGFTMEVFPAHHALAVFAGPVGEQRLAHIDVVGLEQIEVAVVVEVAQADAGSGLVPGAVVVEAAEIGHEIRAADVLEAAVVEAVTVRLENVEPAVRHAAECVLDIVAADGDVEPAVAVDVAEAGLAVVGQLVVSAHPFGDIDELVPPAVAE